MAAEKQAPAPEKSAAPKKAAADKPKEQPARKKGLFEKIQTVRVGLQAEEIKKTGKMNGRTEKPYLELADFIHSLNRLMLEERFTAIVNFSLEEATLTAYDFDSDQTFTIKSPMREAKVQGCNDMQNLGAVETYQRRYLYMAMFDIAESDILDGGLNNNGKNEKAAPDKQIEKPTPEQLKQAHDLSIDLNRLAAYLKCAVDEISKADLADAIKVKQEAMKKKAAAQSQNQTAPEEAK
ncbi:MAG: ERF family protein [Roseburia sp.]|nr:ERF family protein [Roseburia sp.]